MTGCIWDARGARNGRPSRMDGVGRARIVGGLSTLVLSLALCCTAASAVPLSPWWHLASNARPTNLAAEPALLPSRDEVQELTVSATEGEFVLDESVAISKGEFFNSKGEPEFARFHFNAAAHEVQEGLEGIFGKGAVTVSGGPGDEEATKPYIVTFVGGLAGQPVAPMGTISLLSCGGAVGSGCTHSVLEHEVTHGRVAERQIVVTATNLGDATTSGEVVIADKLPSGVRATGIEGIAGESPTNSVGEVRCSTMTLTCRFGAGLPPYDQIEVRIGVVVEPSAGTSGPNEVSVSGGGGARSAKLTRTTSLSDAATPFGVQSFEVSAEKEGGAAVTQAGSHPFQLTTTLAFNQTGAPRPAAMPKDVNIKLPPGLVGNPTPFAQCTLAEFFEEEVAGKGNRCPLQSQVGIAMVTYNEPKSFGTTTVTAPLFNVEPQYGEPARFGFVLPITPVFIDTSVRTGGDYGVTASVSNLSQTAGALASEVTLWGVPGAFQHDDARGYECLRLARNSENAGAPCASGAIQQSLAPLMTMPTACTGPLTASGTLDAWSSPGSFQSYKASQPMAAVDGCGGLTMDAETTMTAETATGSTPTGMDLAIHVPQEGLANPSGLASSSVRETSVLLPAGLDLNPSAANGLASCTEQEMGVTGGGSEPTFSSDPASCPEAAKVGTVEVDTPLLPRTLKGSLYVAAQDVNPFNSLFAVYLVVEDPVSGVRVKLAGRLEPDEHSGRLRATFKDIPQLPFENLTVKLFGGTRATLASPALCGSYPTTTVLTPWSGSSPEELASVPFAITAGAFDGPCQNPLAFAPSLTGGATGVQAAGFTPVSITIGRRDGEQSLHAVQLHMPAGLSGVLTGVKLCGEQQGDQGTCGPESLVGESTVSVGVGGTPLNIGGGRVYLTESYKGAPFGLSIVSPAKAGPFDLGQGACDCVVVRARIEVNPRTAALTVRTDDAGPYEMPTILDGVPLAIRRVNVMIDRAGFTFNPTNCSPLALTGTAIGGEGGTKSWSLPFQVTNCAALAFTPTIGATTSGRTSRLDGASLTVKVSYPAKKFGAEANIAKVHVVLPRRLPSRLATLQKACPAAVFEADPSSCAAAAIVGQARVTTPLLPVPLVGPAYLVSHGGEAFPSLVMVLQGYGVRVELVGTTRIRKGITSTTFSAAPDVPFTTFELSLPKGPHSVLAANGNLCKTKLVMPTSFVAQDGAEQRYATKIFVAGCAKRKNKAGSKTSSAKKGSGRKN